MEAGEALEPAEGREAVHIREVPAIREVQMEAGAALKLAESREAVHLLELRAPREV